MRWRAHQQEPQKSTTGRVGVQEGLTMEGIVRIKETKTKINQINTTKLQNLKVQQQQQQHQDQHQQQNDHEGVGKWVQVKGGTSQ